MSASTAIVFEFQSTFYDDAKTGKNAVCIAVVKCVLPIAGRKFVRTTDPPIPDDAFVRNATKSPTTYRVECNDDVYVDSIDPHPVPGEFDLLKSLVIPTRYQLGGSPEYSAPRTIACVTESLRENNFWIVSNPFEASVTRVEPEPTDDSFLAALFLLVFMFVLLLSQKLCCPSPTQIKEARRFRTVSRLNSAARDRNDLRHTSALTAEEARPLPLERDGDVEAPRS